MCGICGFFNFDGKPADRDILRRMSDVIVHRGPDEDGYLVQDHVALGMRRLSIIDLQTGRQPIPNEDESIWIVFNGEIYNFPELRKSLEALGHKFRTRTDTETIVHAYEQWGTDCPSRLNGMFAFAIWDDRKKQLFLARDRIGIKPLYYYKDDHLFAFGSELKSILQIPQIPRELNLEGLDLYLTYEYVPAPYSILKNIYKLPPGYWLLLHNGKVDIQPYWELEFNENKNDFEACKEELLDLLQDAVKMQLISDVPLGAFLSGGIDSSTVVALMARVMDRPVKTFSIGFENQSYNELNYARIIAEHFQTEHHELILQPDALEWTEKLLHFLDEPLGDFSIFPTYLVSKMARDHVKVVLSGDGGDELFGGYETYIADWLDRSYQRYVPRLLREKVIAAVTAWLPPTEKKKGVINRLKRFVEGSSLPADLEHTRWMLFLAEEEKRSFYSSDVLASRNGRTAYDFMRNCFRSARTNDRLNRQLYVDIKTYLADDILVKVDRMSMAVSLEARVPYLDHRVVEFSAALPGRFKQYHHRTKIILKEAARGLLPPQILERGKEGFSIPIKSWIRNELRPLMLEVLDSKRIQRDGLFNPRYVERLIHEHLDRRENHSHRLWALMVFHIWKDLYVDRHP